MNRKRTQKEKKKNPPPYKTGTRNFGDAGTIVVDAAVVETTAVVETAAVVAPAVLDAADAGSIVVDAADSGSILVDAVDDHAKERIYELMKKLKTNDEDTKRILLGLHHMATNVSPGKITFNVRTGCISFGK
jgi:hypothetical protein